MGINVGASMICEHESFVGQHLKNQSRIQISWEIFLKLILDFHSMFNSRKSWQHRFEKKQPDP